VLRQEHRQLLRQEVIVRLQEVVQVTVPQGRAVLQVTVGVVVGVSVGVLRVRVEVVQEDVKS
jgi:hypothetical protein